MSSLAPWLFALLLGVILPLLGLAVARRAGGESIETTFGQVYGQLLAVQLIVGGLAWWAAGSIRAPIPIFRAIDGAAAVGCVVLVTGMLALSTWLKGRRGVRRMDDVLRPKTTSQHLVAWPALGLVAVVEEYAYRGVFFGLLAQATGSGWIGAGVSALCFGLAHGAQGPGGMAASVLFALLLQGLVLHGGSLLPAMLAHLAYNALAAVLAGRVAAKKPGNKSPA
jgi:membrane protease YdiL (CAAX protease family)